MADEPKFKAGDIPTKGLELDWTIRDAGVGDISEDSYWPTLPPHPPGRGVDAIGLYAVLSAIRSCVSMPIDGKFHCTVHVSNLFTFPAERMWQAAKKTIKAEAKLAEDNRREACRG